MVEAAGRAFGGFVNVVVELIVEDPRRCVFSLQKVEERAFSRSRSLLKKYKVSRMSSTPYMRHIEYDYIVQTVRFHFWPPLSHFGEFLYCSYLNSNSCVEKALLVRFNQPNPVTHDIRPPQILAQDFLERDHRLHLQPL